MRIDLEVLNSADQRIDREAESRQKDALMRLDETAPFELCS